MSEIQLFANFKLSKTLRKTLYFVENILHKFAVFSFGNPSSYDSLFRVFLRISAQIFAPPPRLLQSDSTNILIHEITVCSLIACMLTTILLPTL